MRVLIGCECSCVVRDEFRKLGHDAWSCDLLPAEKDSKYHIQGDVLNILNDDWDLGIFHPTCTYLTVSGNRWYYHPEDKHLPFEQRRPHPLYPNRRKDREEAIKFFMRFVNCKIPKIAIENPIGIMSTVYRKPDQIIQPWQFGHGETKATCLWLKNLPKLVPTNIVEGREQRIFKMPPSPERAKERSRTYPGIGGGHVGSMGYQLNNAA